MAYNIKLFVHGVPNGQEIWGTHNSAETQYIETFYGRKSDVDYQMLLEIMQLGGETNAYYTYLYCKNVQDSSNRQGGYLALTLRINYYYTDVKNIYNLLDAAFNKYIIGSVVGYTPDGGLRYLVSTFNRVDSNLKALEKELQHYLMQFSVDKDFVNLNGFRSNGQNGCSKFNIIEAESNIVENQVKLNGRISVSSLYHSSKEKQITDKMNAEMAKVKSQVQKEIETLKKEIVDKKRYIADISNESKETVNTISRLKAEINKANSEIESLLRKIKDLTQQPLGKDDEHSPQIPTSSHINIKSQLIKYAIVAILFVSIGFVLHKVFGENPEMDNKSNYGSTVTVTERDSSNNSVQFNTIELTSGSKVRIDLDSLNEKMNVGKYYKLSLMSGNDTIKIQGGQWKSQEFKIQGNSVCATEKGNDTVMFIDTCVLVIKRPLEAEKQ